MNKLFKSLLVVGLWVVGVFLFSRSVSAVKVTGSWSASDSIPQGGSLELRVPVHGGNVDGTFSGGGGSMFQYGGRFTGSFDGGWEGKMRGSFDGWASMVLKNPSTGEQERTNYDIAGTWSGYLRSDGTGYAKFVNHARFGLDGTIFLRYSTDVFEREYGSKFGEESETENGVGAGKGNSEKKDTRSLWDKFRDGIMDGLFGKILDKTTDDRGQTMDDLMGDDPDKTLEAEEDMQEHEMDVVDIAVESGKKGVEIVNDSTGLWGKVTNFFGRFKKTKTPEKEDDF